MKILRLLALVALVVACDEDLELLGPAPPPGALRFVDLDVGYLHACGLRASGSVYCWGRNVTGALGNGGNEPSLVPVPVQTSRAFVEIESGSAHNCGLTANGSAWCWGHNDEGQLGDATFIGRTTPVEVTGNHDFVTISVGHAHACGIDTDGAAWCWGDDIAGQLGNGTGDGVQKTPVPVQVDLTQPFRAISAGYYQTCGLTTAGAAYCWGINYAGQNGDGSFDNRHSPVAVEGGLTFDTIAAGDGIVCALDDEDVHCWGSNRFFELAREPESVVTEPVQLDVGAMLQVSPAIGAETVGGSRPYVCGVGTNHRGQCWGGAIPALRDGGAQPTVLDGSIELSMIASGPQFVCGLRSDGYAYCAGAGSSGQLGNGDEQDRGALTPVAAPE